MFPDLITPRAFPDFLQRPDYDPLAVIPTPMPPRPRVFTTAIKLAHAVERLAKREPIDLACMNLMIEGCGLSQPAPTAVGAEATPDSIARAALRNAVAFHITTEARHFDRALELLRLFSLSNAWDQWTGFESQTIGQLAGAYDLLAVRTLHTTDNAVIRDMLMAMPGVLDRPGHRRCNNHNVFNIMARLAVGLALEHRPTIHDALYGLERAGQWRYGLIHQLRHDLLSDGMQWEGSMSYHMLVMAGLCESITMLENIGVDLWRRGLPSAMQDEGHDEHRGWGPKGEKCIRAGVDAFIYQAMSNGDYCNIHDQILGNIRGAGVWWPIFMKAYEMYGDGRYAAILHRMNRDYPAAAGDVRPVWFRQANGDLEWIRLETRSLPPGNFSYADDAKISLVGRHENGCSLFPVHGSAVLRGEPGNAESLSAYFYFGPHWAGHRSPCALHLDMVFNNTRITHAPHLFKDGYAGPMHHSWHRATIAHNTVTVDERPMFPFDFETGSLWETDYWRSRVSDSELRFFSPGKEFKAVRVCNDNVYEGSLLDRTIVATPTMLIDVFRVSSAAEHQFDWALHLHGSIARPSNAAPIVLGNQRGYRHLSDAWQHPQRTGRLTMPLNLAGVDATGHVFLPTQGSPSIIVANDPPPDGLTPIGDTHAPEPRQALIVRNQTRACVFVSAWQFGASAAAPTLVSSDARGDVVLDIPEAGSARRWHFYGEGGVERK
jgi:hypothetical protein